MRFLISFYDEKNEIPRYKKIIILLLLSMPPMIYRQEIYLNCFIEIYSN